MSSLWRFAHNYTRTEHQVEQEAKLRGIYLLDWHCKVTDIELNTYTGKFWVFFKNGDEGIVMPLFQAFTH